MNPTFFASPAAFRKWLAKHHDKESELLVGFYKKDSGRPSITWPESVDQALCFGWIDGVRRRIDDVSYSIRFTPRKQRSTWSAINIGRVAELSRLGECLGGQPSTFAGLAGMGDLVATCMSPQSRNRTVGFLLGQGRTLDAILEEMNTVAEGVKSCRPLLETARGFGIEMPICEQVVAVCHGGRTAREAGIELLARKVTTE